MKNLMAAACAALVAGAAFAEKIRVTDRCRLKFEKSDIAIQPYVFLPGWKISPPKPVGSVKDELHGIYPFTINLENGAQANGRAAYSQLADGKISARWFLTSPKEQKVEQICVGIGLPGSVEGGVYEVDGKRERFPKIGEKFHFGYKQTARKVRLESRDGGHLCTFEFEQPTRIMFQNYKQSFEMRILDASNVLKPGEIYSCGAVISGKDALELVEPKPFVIKEGPEWVKLAAKANVKPGTALDFSAIGGTDAPAGKYGRVVARGANFEFEKCPGRALRFYGVNLCFGANYFNTPEQSETFAQNLKRLGYNSVRIHHHDGMLVKKGGDATELDPVRMRELDALVAAFYKHGLYVTTDLFVSRGVPYKAVGIDKPGNVEMGEFKLLVRTNELAFANLCKFSKNWFGHVNEFTGRRWADEPGLAWVHLVNENCTDQFTKKEQTDWAKFIADENRFYARMTKFMRDEVGAKQIFSDLNGWSTDPRWAPCREKFDYVDMHFYVDHPWFFEKSWQLPSRCRNVLPFDGKDVVHGVSSAARCELKTKPFTITEWNFSAPGSYRGIGGIATGAIAAREDWDGLWRFAWSHSKEGVQVPDTQSLRYFDMAGDPLALASERATMCLYTRRDIRVGDANAFTFDGKEGRMTINTEMTCGGFARSGEINAGDVTVKIVKTPATVWASSLDSAPLRSSKRILVTHLTDVQNSGARFASDDMTVLLEWGRHPHLMRAGTAEVSIAVRGGSYTVYALDSDGTRRGKVSAKLRNGKLTFTADVARDTANATYIYEIVAR